MNLVPVIPCSSPLLSHRDAIFSIGLYKLLFDCGLSDGLLDFDSIGNQLWMD